MKTKKVYVTNLNIITNKKFLGDLGSPRVEFDSKQLSFVLVKKYRHTFKNLKTNERYYAIPGIFSEVGDHFVSGDTVVSFNEFSSNNEKRLSKKKIISIYDSKK